MGLRLFLLDSRLFLMGCFEGSRGCSLCDDELALMALVVLASSGDVLDSLACVICGAC